VILRLLNERSLRRSRSFSANYRKAIMPKSVWFAVLGAAVLALSVIPWSGERVQSQKRGSVDGSAIRAELERLRDELDRERAERKRAVGELESQLLELLSERPQAAAQGAQQLAPGDEDEPQVQRLAIGAQDPRAKFETEFTEQVVDGAWAQETERALHGLVTQNIKSAALRSLKCHKTMCRLETEVADPQDYWAFMSEAFRKPETRIWSGDAYTAQPTEAPGTGPVKLLTYLVREGSRMPSM
jgi:hypothetical protein